MKKQIFGYLVIVFMFLVTGLLAFGNDFTVGIENEGNNLPVIAVVVTGVYEILSRIIPTVKDYTIVGRFIKWIHKVSDLLNVRKNAY